MVAEMNLLEHVCPMLLNGLPTVNRSTVRYKNRVLGEERGHGEILSNVVFRKVSHP
jgi:hypothetical protein